jgi:hypothetical protein
MMTHEDLMLALVALRIQQKEDEKWRKSFTFRVWRYWREELWRRLPWKKDS